MTFGDYFYSGETTWIRPDGHSDPSNAWTGEENAYDDNTTTYATGNVPPQWGSFLHLTFSTPLESDRLRLMLGGPATNRTVDVDVKVNGVWVHVFQGAYALWVDTWKEKTFGQGNVDEVRIRFYNGYTYAVNCYVRDVGLWQVSIPPTPPPKGCLVMALFGTTLLARCFPYLRLFRDRVLPEIITDSYYALSTWLLGVFA